MKVKGASLLVHFDCGCCGVVHLAIEGADRATPEQLEPLIRARLWEAWQECIKGSEMNWHGEAQH